MKEVIKYKEVEMLVEFTVIPYEVVSSSFTQDADIEIDSVYINEIDCTELLEEQLDDIALVIENLLQ